MTDPSRRPDATWGSADDSRSNARRWVKVTGVIVAVVILLVVGWQLLGGAGGHGPGRHGGPPNGDHSAPAEGHVPPEGAHG
jgi:hypothetical protein